MKKGVLKKGKTVFGITEYKMSNGLRVLFKRDRSAPVVAVCVTFHVGSRNEAKGHTGATHILEHLLFKDSKHFNKENGKSITSHLDWLGAASNATTWYDRTNYFEILPKEHLEEALALEADRMRNSLFSDEDLASEMTVVRNEYERSRNNPFELLDEEMWLTAFTKHPYRIATIGLKEDIEASTAATLRNFYDKFYWPNNATLSVFGDVTWSEVSPLVMRLFAAIPSSPQPIPEMTIVEPQQTKPKKVLLKKPLGINIASLAYKAPPALSPDFPALLVLTQVLAGGYSGRLQKRLVDVGLASEVACIYPALRDEGLCMFVAHVGDGVTPKTALAAMREELHTLSTTAPSKDELLRARERLLAQMAYDRDGVFASIRAVSESLAAGDWRLMFKLEKAINRVTQRQVMEAAATYLTKKTETEGVLLDAEESL